MGKEKSNIIPGDTEICEFDGVNTATVYTGGLSDLKIADGRKTKDGRFAVTDPFGKNIRLFVRCA